MNTPIALIVFKRPETTARTLAAIAKVRPQRLFVIADGPRNDAEAESCRKTRAVIESVNWPCRIDWCASDTNLGCRWRPITGLDYVFSKVDRAIILEDDCLPDSSFFDYCTILLDRFECDEHIMHIGGGNSQPWWRRYRGSYYVTRYPHGWGWATWARAWARMDARMADWPVLRDQGWLERLTQDPRERAFWRDRFDAAYAPSNVSVWDYAWLYACWKHDAVGISPAVNLVQNIGFGEDATHTTKRFTHLSRPARRLGPMVHPSDMSVYARADRYTFEHSHLLMPAAWVQAWRLLSNRWTYGQLLRRLPWAGPLWAACRLKTGPVEYKRRWQDGS